MYNKTDGDVKSEKQRHGVADPGRWLLLVYQLPATSSNARVKTWRRLQQIGAVALRGSAYVLPNSPQAREDFEWMKSEIGALGGHATVLAAASLEARGDEEIVAAFRAAREADYSALVKDLVIIERRIKRTAEAAARGPAPLDARVIRACRERFAQIAAIDFFAPPLRLESEKLLMTLEEKMRGRRSLSSGQEQTIRIDLRDYAARTWVTRPKPGVDRMSSAWLIRSFIDPKATFVFQDKPTAEQVPFDMYEGEFSHHGGLCTFEVLVERFSIADPAVRRIAEIVHDLDLKDARFQPPEAGTVGALVQGLRGLPQPDHDILERGIELFQSLYRSMSAQPARARRERRVTPGKRATRKRR